MTTLRRILEIETKWIGTADYESLDRAERLWIAANRPTERIALMSFLEDFLRSCARNGYTYAPIFLRRKRELQRGDWKPRQDAPKAQYDPTCGGKIPREWIEQAEKESRQKRAKIGVVTNKPAINRENESLHDALWMIREREAMNRQEQEPQSCD